MGCLSGGAGPPHMLPRNDNVPKYWSVWTTPRPPYDESFERPRVSGDCIRAIWGPSDPYLGGPWGALVVGLVPLTCSPGMTMSPNIGPSGPHPDPPMTNRLKGPGYPGTVSGPFGGH